MTSTVSPGGSTTDDERSTTTTSHRTTRARRDWSRRMRRPRVDVVAGILVVVLLAVGGLAGLVLSAATTRLYAAEAVVRVFNPYRVAGSQFGSVDPLLMTNLERQYAESPAVSDAATTQLDAAGVSYDSASWSADEGSATIAVRTLAADAAASAAAATAFAEQYVAARSAASAEPLAVETAAISSELRELRRQVAQLQQRVDRSGEVSTDATRGLLAQQTGLLAQVSQLATTRQEVRSQSEALAQNYQIVVPATVPEAPATPQTARNAVIGALAGGLLGLLLALAVFGRQLRDRRPGAAGAGGTAVEDPQDPA